MTGRRGKVFAPEVFAPPPKPALVSCRDAAGGGQSGKELIGDLGRYQANRRIKQRRFLTTLPRRIAAPESGFGLLLGRFRPATNSFSPSTGRAGLTYIKTLTTVSPD